MKNKKNLIIALITILLVGVVIKFSLRTPQANPEVIESKSVPPLNHPVERTPEVVTEAPSKKNPLSVKLEDLPTMDALQGLSDEELHHTPDVIKEAGAKIGKLIEEADANPELRAETLNFLKSCAEGDEVNSTIRALCWNRTLNQIDSWNIFLSISDANVPEEIKILATKIP